MIRLLRTSGKVVFSWPVLSCLFLGWFYLGTTWYPGAILQVSGTLGDISKRIDIHWDSGQGLNGYERERFHFEPLPLQQGEDGVALIITRTGTRNSAAGGKKVVLRSITVDGQGLNLADIPLAPGIERENASLVFKEDGASLHLMVKPQSSLRVEFPVFNYAGEVDVQLAGTRTRHDLYASNNESQWGGRRAKILQSWFVTEQGAFTISMPMPRYRVNALRITPSDNFQLSSAIITAENGQTFSLSGGEFKKGIIYSTAEFNKQRQQHFHPDRFFFQIVFAVFSAWLLSSLLSFARRFKGVKDIFFSENRHLFWLMLLSGCLVFSFWQISFWPAIMSNDSLEIWRAAQIPGTYLGDHPPLNVVYYLFLSQFWSNVAVVPFAQNFLTSLLIAYILFTLYRKGLPWFVLIPCFALIVSSIPVGLYTAILWKDVPFALIALLLGFELARLSHEKRNKGLDPSKKQWLYLLCLTLALIGFRHNGILYLFLVPGILLLFGIVQIRIRALSILLSVIVVFGLVFFLHPKNSNTSAYLVDQGKKYLQQAIKQPALEYFKASGQNYLGIFDVHQNRMQWDLVHLCFYGRYTNDFIRGLRWNDVYPYLRYPKQDLVQQVRDTAVALYWKSYQVPWVYFSWNPFYVLLLLPFLPLLYRFIPMTAVFSFSVFIPVAILVFLSIFNWRYYYFAHLASYFLIPMLAADLFSKRRRECVHH